MTAGGDADKRAGFRTADGKVWRVDHGHGATGLGGLEEWNDMLPAKKKSKNDKRKRRAHHALTPVHLVSCPKCGNARLPHCACGRCGYVNRKLMIEERLETE